MTDYRATIRWRRNDGSDFLGNRYSRGHTWSFDGGVDVPASSSPHVVPTPMSLEDAVDPEEAFVASLSSCHMLWFLSIAAKNGFVVDSYVDKARGTMGRNRDGKVAFTAVVLSPKTGFSGERKPTAAELEAMHHAAHERCFIASSVKCEIGVVPEFGPVEG